jgi:hypothetical protein
MTSYARSGLMFVRLPRGTKVWNWYAGLRGQGMGHQRLAWFGLVLALGGCSGSNDPMGLLPTNVQAIIASDRAREQQTKGAGDPKDASGGEKVAEAPSGKAIAAAPLAPLDPKQTANAAGAPMPAENATPGARPPSAATANVQDILARARTAPPAPPVQLAGPPGRPMPAQGGPFVPIQRAETGEEGPRRAIAAPATSIASGTTRAVPPQLLPVERTSPTQKMPLDQGLKLSFAPGAKLPSDFEQARLAAAIANARLGRGARVTLMLGPGSSDSSFERLVLARRRGDAVATLLPQGLDIVQEYKPELPPDAVWVIFGARAVTEFATQ